MYNINKRFNILGYPFAGGQPRVGVEETPDWLFTQTWFKELMETSEGKLNFEMVPVTNRLNNTANDLNIKNGYIPGAKNWQNLLQSA